MFFKRKQPQQLIVYCDGAIGDRGHATGLGVIIRDAEREIIGLVKQSLPPLTNNEAEYAALVLALQSVQRYRPASLQIYMDSEIVVGQMTGRFSVNSAALKRWHSQTCRLVRDYEAVSFNHIPRESNRLADALANEALAEGEARSKK